jgi:hypothetical protein
MQPVLATCAGERNEERGLNAQSRLTSGKTAFFATEGLSPLKSFAKSKQQNSQRSKPQPKMPPQPQPQPVQPQLHDLLRAAPPPPNAPDSHSLPKKRNPRYLPRMQFRRKCFVQSLRATVLWNRHFEYIARKCVKRSAPGRSAKSYSFFRTCAQLTASFGPLWQYFPMPQMFPLKSSFPK